MASNSNGSDRRAFIQGLAAVVGGLAGASACAPQGAPGAGGGLSPGAGLPTGSGSFSLLGNGRRLAPVPLGGVIDPAAMGFGGPLVDPATGQEVGRFTTQALGGRGGLELLQLELPDGALYGAGPAGGSRDQRSYAILGGTGRFGGARGTFTTRELAGGGSGRTLEFSGTLS